VFPRSVAVYLELSAAGARPRRTVSRQRDRGDGRMIDNAIEGRTEARSRFEPSWLIVRDDLGAGGGPPEVLTLEAGGNGELEESVLPVFSFEEEALLFLRLCGFGVGGASARAAPRTSPRFSPMRARTPGASPSTPSPRSTGAGPTISSAYREKSSSGGSPPGDDTKRGAVARHGRSPVLQASG
jgi:hypothetical protein